MYIFTFFQQKNSPRLFRLSSGVRAAAESFYLSVAVLCNVYVSRGIHSATFTALISVGMTRKNSVLSYRASETSRAYLVFISAARIPLSLLLITYFLFPVKTLYHIQKFFKTV